MILWLPSFFLVGMAVFNGYPRLITTNDGIGSLRYAISAGKAKPLLALVRGFILLYPIPGWILHWLMVLSYPFLTAWAIGTALDTTETA